MREAVPGNGTFRAMDPRQLSHLLNTAAVLLFLLSYFSKDSLAYLFVLASALMPAFLWVKYGAFGIPVLPVLGALYYLYYAMPLLAGNTLTTYKPSELMWAALSVGYFLITATLTAWPFFAAPHFYGTKAGRGQAARYVRAAKQKSFGNLATGAELHRLVFTGLALGLVFGLALVSDEVGFLGSFSGVVRAIIFPLTYVACYLTGFGRGTGALVGHRWIMAFTGVLAVTVLSMSSLFLVGGAMNIAAIVLGYVLGKRRLPWLGIGVAFVVLTVLNAGKGSIREAYWAPDSQTVQNLSILHMPIMLAEWCADGIGAMTSGAVVHDGPSLLERTSLLQMVLAVQQETPAIIPYLHGETYAMLPSMLVPRFLDPGKIESQAVLNLLSVRYGRETEESTTHTTIGWGMVAEAYANDGNLAVIVMGALFGVLCGFLMRLSITAGPTSLAMLIAIASALTLCDVESDFSYTMVTLLQTIAGICIFAVLPRFTKKQSAAPISYASKRAG